MSQNRSDPFPAFNFQVIVPGIADDPNAPRAGFSEVSGIGASVDVIEYRTGGDHTIRKLPGMAHYSNVILKRGVVADLAFWNWMQSGIQGSVVRADVAIVLLDEQRNQVMRWTLRRAWVTKYEGPALNAKGSEVAIESIELAHEGLEIELG